MLCPGCQRENEPGSRFCIFCGSPLTTGGEESPQEPSSAIADELRQLRELVARITDRLDALESGQGVSTPAPPPVPPPPVPSKPPEPVPVEPVREVTPVPAEIVPPRKVKPVRTEPREWEQILGGSWLARIGVLALIIGIGFFLKYAFDNDWLGPAGRVILGIVASLVMLGAGYRWRQRYPILTRVLSGGGVAVLYLSIFASFAIYDLVNLYVAFAFLFLVSAATAVLALRYDSMSLAVLGIIGAFMAPFLLGGFGDRGPDVGGSGQAVQLMAYIIVVDLGVMALAAFRNWRWFTLLALGCSLIAFGVWYGEFDRTIGKIDAEIFLTLIFLVFVGATTLFHVIWRRAPQAFDFSLMMINAAAYFGISLGLLWTDFRAWMGSFVFLLALFYGAVSYMAYRRRAESTNLSLFALGIAMIFLTVAIPVQLGDKAWTTIAWVAEGTILMWLAFRAGMPLLRYSSYIVFFAVAIRLIAFDTFIPTYDFQPVFNERFLAFIVAIAAMSFTAWFIWRNRGRDKGFDYLVFLGVADFFALLIIGAEIFSYSTGAITLSASLSLIVLLVLAGVMVLYPLVWRRKTHAFDIFLAILNSVGFVVMSVFLWEYLRAWMGLLYFILALFYGILKYVAAKRGADSADLGSVSLCIALIFFTGAVAVQLEDTVWTTITWAVEGAILIWLFFRLRIPELRFYGYLVFFAVAVRLLFFDTGVDIKTFQPVINERFLAFIVSIAAMYAAGYCMLQEIKVSGWGRANAAVFLIAAGFFTIWLLSFEVWDYFRNSLITAEASTRGGLRDAQHLSLTAVWAFYAVIALIVGIWKRWRYLRLGALALLLVPIFKVFVYDVFQLELGYRIGAFVGLGVLLLVSSYLYQRYSGVIKGIFTEK